MKIIDTTGRKMLVDLVYKDSNLGWLQAPSFRLEGRSTIFARLPYGEYALRICSLGGADLLLFEDGQELIKTTVAERTQLVAKDSQGNPLRFLAPDEKPNETAAIIASQSTVRGDSQMAGRRLDAKLGQPSVPTGTGLVFAVLRFAKQSNPFGEPPQEEFAISYQMCEPVDFSERFAQNFRLLVEASALPNPRDEFSFEPAADSASQFYCAFTGHKH